MSLEKNKEIKESIIKEFGKTKGTFALAFKELAPGGEPIFIRENEFFHAASTMKTSLMIEVFAQVQKGKLNLEDTVLIKNEFKSIIDGSVYSLNMSDDGGEELYNFINKPKSIYELVYYMITVSSNLASNILVEIVGAKNVMETLKSMGVNNTKIIRGVEDLKAFELGKNNITTAYDLLTIFESIALKKIISEKACDEMIKILSEQKCNSVIPAKLPSNVVVAHKTGTIMGVVHDSGIIYLPDGRKYILIILSKNLNDMQTGTNVCANVSRMLYDYFQSK